MIDFDIRQSQTRILQDQLDSAATTQMDSVLASINNELTPPGRLIAQSTPSLVVTVGSGTLVNPNTSKNRILPQINSTVLNFTGGTITFPSASGTITVSPGSNASITIGASQFVAVLVQLNSNGQLGLSVGTPVSSLGAVVVPGGSPSSLSLGYIIVESNGSSAIQNITNAMLYQFVGGGGSGGGTNGGSKNYLTSIITSTSSGVPNPGNGNFESASTSGWSLAHSTLSGVTPTATATPGSAFSSTSGGSAASGNLSLSVVNTNQLAGSYSGDLASSAASVAGDILISNAFFIDSEDKAKMMQVKFYYESISGTMNFSGTSSNTFAVWIYDVTNGLWIQPQGIYNLVQETGIGYCTATFQTTANSTQYQLALININATSGAYSLYIDDFSVGPQIAPMAPAVSDWVAFTPTAGLFTGITLSGLWRRVGDSMEMMVEVDIGSSPAAGQNLAFSGPSGYTIDTTKLTNSAESGPALGIASFFTLSSGDGWSGTVVYNSAGGNPLNYSIVGPNGPNTFWGTFGSTPTTWANGDRITCIFKAPIVGWSSNSVASSDTDTRVVAAIAQASGGQTVPTSTATLMQYNLVSSDTHGAYNSSTYTYTIPVSGYYQITASAFLDGTTASSTGTELAIRQNGIGVRTGLSEQVTGTGSSAVVVSSLLKCNAGDTIAFYVQQGSGNTFTVSVGSADENVFSINRVSGPAVITATETVSCKYLNGAGTSIPTSGTNVPFTTKVYDTHDSFNGTTYTVPVSGKYHVSCGLNGTAQTYSTLQGFSLYAFVTSTPEGLSSVQEQLDVVFGNGATIGLTPKFSKTYYFYAGDTIFIQAASGVATTLSTDAVRNYFCIERVGN